MTRLDYSTRGSPPMPAALWALPTAAISMSMLITLHNMDQEPFGVFLWKDAVIQVGGNAIVVVLWLAWVVVAWRNRYRKWIAAVLLLGLWDMSCSAWLGLGYFGEPWMYYGP